LAASALVNLGFTETVVLSFLIFVFEELSFFAEDGVVFNFVSLDLGFGLMTFDVFTGFVFVIFLDLGFTIFLELIFLVSLLIFFFKFFLGLTFLLSFLVAAFLIVFVEDFFGEDVFFLTIFLDGFGFVVFFFNDEDLLLVDFLEVFFSDFFVFFLAAIKNFWQNILMKTLFCATKYEI
jgi:hypothetical protein